MKEPSTYRPYLWPLKRQSLLRSKAPILVGPFRSEVGFEAMYWLPFLEKLVHDGVARERLIPITRGGAACWYQTKTGLELYAMRSPTDVRIENRLQVSRTGLLKQMRITPFDRGVLRDAAATLGLTRYHVLHPAWMYQVLAPFWRGTVPAPWLDRHTTQMLLPPPPLPDGITLPPTFVAVRFYARPTFPAHGAALAIVQQTVPKIAAQLPVIVLHNDDHLDDHFDLQIAKIPNVTLLRDLVTTLPETNLAVQSAILARSTAFVGTYGGFSQLALRFGRPVLAYYDTFGGTAVAHKVLAETIAMHVGVPFQVVACKDAGLLSCLLPQAIVRVGAKKSLEKAVDTAAEVVPTGVA